MNGIFSALIIISSSITSPIKEYCRKHDIYNLFDEIFGADVHMSKVEKIKMVLVQQSKGDFCILQESSFLNHIGICGCYYIHR